VGIDRTPPSPALRQAAPRAAWENLDISDAAAVSGAFQHIARSHGGIDFVTHFAVCYHYGRGWHTQQKLDGQPRDEYCILNRLPVLTANFRDHRRDWLTRNIRRNEGNYQFEL
jgi:NAD(P)-dependent dehydrogenase (short-subunit alcohol dehydrogenase family)